MQQRRHFCEIRPRLGALPKQARYRATLRPEGLLTPYPLVTYPIRKCSRPPASRGIWARIGHTGRGAYPGRRKEDSRSSSIGAGSGSSGSRSRRLSAAWFGDASRAQRDRSGVDVGLLVERGDRLLYRPGVVFAFRHSAPSSSVPLVTPCSRPNSWASRKERRGEGRADTGPTRSAPLFSPTRLLARTKRFPRLRHVLDRSCARFRLWETRTSNPKSASRRRPERGDE